MGAQVGDDGFPPLRAPQQRPGLLERDAELDTLIRALRALVSEQTGGVVLIEGPPGIGKTTLLEAALETPLPAAPTILRTRGSELEATLAFGGARDLLTPAVMGVAAKERKALFDGPAHMAAPVLGFESAQAQRAEADPLYGLFWLTAAIAERAPLVLAVDDVHWLDEESARFAAYLARRVAGLPILLFGTLRPNEPGSESEAFVVLREHAQIVAPGPLSVDAIGCLVPERPPEEVHRATGGNPLLAVELERALTDADAGAELDAVAPASVGRSVLDRVTRISPAAVALSRAVALSPEALTLADAAELAELEPDVAAVSADALVRGQVLATDGATLRFLHPMMRTAVYETLGPFERRRAHSRAAGLLADRGADVDAIAAHLLAGEPGADPENIRILRTAAERALGRIAPRAAIRYLQRALAEPMPPGPDRVGVRYEVGRLQHTVGDEEAIATLEAALDEAERPDQLADITLELAEVLIFSERYSDAMVLLERVRGRGDLDPERRVDVDALNLRAALDLMIEPAEVSRLAARIPADLPGDTPAQRRALCDLAYYLLVEGRSNAEAIELLERIQDETLADASLRAGDAQYVLRVLSLTGSIALAETFAEELLELARESGVETLYSGAQLQLAIAANQRGELRESEAALRLGLASPGILPSWRLALEDWLVTTLSMQGRFEEAEALLDQVVTAEGTIGEAMLDRRRMELAIDRGDYAAALEPARRVFEAAAGRIAPSSAVNSDYAIVLHAAGEVEEARTIARRTLDAAVHADAPPQTLGVVSSALGQVLGGEEGLEHLERAVAILSDSPFRWNQANAEVALGAALRRAGQRVRAREHLASALEYAARSGAEPIEKRAREELRLCGARPRRAVRTGIDALTPSEDRIARLAADGMSNKEMAAHLFLTVKTVEMHLGSAYRKLDISSRKDLPALFAAEAA